MSWGVTPEKKRRPTSTRSEGQDDGQHQKEDLAGQQAGSRHGSAQPEGSATDGGVLLHQLGNDHRQQADLEDCHQPGKGRGERRNVLYHLDNREKDGERNRPRPPAGSPDPATSPDSGAYSEGRKPTRFSVRFISPSYRPPNRKAETSWPAPGRWPSGTWDAPSDP